MCHYGAAEIPDAMELGIYYNGNRPFGTFISVKHAVKAKFFKGGTIMDTREAVANRIRQLCKEHKLTPNGLSYTAAVPQSTVKSILNGESKNPGIVTIKMLCDGIDITLGEFFSTPEFDALEQEIK